MVLFRQPLDDLEPADKAKSSSHNVPPGWIRCHGCESTEEFVHRNWRRCPKCHTQRSHGHRSPVEADLSIDSEEDDTIDARFSRATSSFGPAASAGLLGLSAASMAAKKFRRLRSQGEKALKLSWYAEGMRKKNGVIDTWAPSGKDEMSKLPGVLARLERMRFGGSAEPVSEGSDQEPWKQALKDFSPEELRSIGIDPSYLHYKNEVERECAAAKQALARARDLETSRSLADTERRVQSSSLPRPSRSPQLESPTAGAGAGLLSSWHLGPGPSSASGTSKSGLTRNLNLSPSQGHSGWLDHDASNLKASARASGSPVNSRNSNQPGKLWDLSLQVASDSPADWNGQDEPKSWAASEAGIDVVVSGPFGGEEDPEALANALLASLLLNPTA